MDVNVAEWSQKEFQDLSGVCSSKEDWMCLKTKYACKDYLCPFVKEAKDINEVRAKLLKQ